MICAALKERGNDPQDGGSMQNFHRYLNPRELADLFGPRPQSRCERHVAPGCCCLARRFWTKCYFAGASTWFTSGSPQGIAPLTVIEHDKPPTA